MKNRLPQNFVSALPYFLSSLSYQTVFAQHTAGNGNYVHTSYDEKNMVGHLEFLCQV